MKNVRLIISVIATAIVVAISLYLIFGYEPGDLGNLVNRQANNGGDGTTTVFTGTIDVGTKVEVARNSVGTSGGNVTVNKPGDMLDGFQLEVPANSYNATRTFQVSYAPVKSHTFGKNFNPISPLISVENGGGYSEEVMVVKIPVQIPEGHFAMAFFYDSSSGQLEGVPLVTEDNNSITIATRHFSNTIISSIEEYRLTGLADSGFKPGVNDWLFPNYGSYLEPGGHCAGQSLSSMWYYYEKSKSTPLYDLYDNNGNEKTPAIWQDDSLAYKLASVVQNDIKWDSLVFKYMLRESKQWSAKQQFEAFAYSILATGQPQLVGMYDTKKGGGHAMVVYRTQNGNLCVADPNYPGVSNRIIKYTNNAFEPYNSGANQNDIKSGNPKQYNQILYISKSAIINWSQITSRWNELEKKTIGTSKFPAYTLLAIKKDGTTMELKDGLTTDQDTLTIEARSNPLLGTSIYRDNNWLRIDAQGEPLVDTNTKVTLKQGKNKLGIWVCARMMDANASAYWSWFDFKWVTVTYTQAPTPTTSLDKATIVDASIKTVWYPDSVYPQGVDGWGAYGWVGSVTIDFGVISLPKGTWLTLKPLNFAELDQKFSFIAYPGKGFETIELQSTGPVHQVTFKFSTSGELYVQKQRPSPPTLVVNGLLLVANPWGAAPPIPPDKEYWREYDIVITAASP